jgi:hypothetical protein
MKKWILFLSLITLFKNSNSQQKDTTNYFEGYIEYKTEFKSLMQGVSDNELRDRIGHTLKIYYKEEKVKWIFTDDLGYVRSYLIMDGKTNIQYDWSSDSPDTLYSYNLSNPNRTVLDSMKDNGTEIVLSCKCQIGVFYASNYYENFDQPTPTLYNYSFCPDYKLNPKWSENNKSMSWDKIMAKYKSVPLKISTNFGTLFTANFTAININADKLDTNIFLIDKTKIIKPTFVN